MGCPIYSTGKFYWGDSDFEEVRDMVGDRMDKECPSQTAGNADDGSCII